MSNDVLGPGAGLMKIALAGIVIFAAVAGFAIAKTGDAWDARRAENRECQAACAPKNFKMMEDGCYCRTSKGWEKK